MANIKHIHCPVNGWDCPYYTNHPQNGCCSLKYPFEECDDFASFWDEGDDWIDNDEEAEHEFEPGRVYWDEMEANP